MKGPLLITSNTNYLKAPKMLSNPRNNHLYHFRNRIHKISRCAPSESPAAQSISRPKTLLTTTSPAQHLSQPAEVQWTKTEMKQNIYFLDYSQKESRKNKSGTQDRRPRPVSSTQQQVLWHRNINASVHLSQSRHFRTQSETLLSTIKNPTAANLICARNLSIWWQNPYPTCKFQIRRLLPAP